MLDKLRDQEQELQRLKGAGAQVSPQALASEQLLGGMSSAVLVFDRDGRLAVLNPAAERLLGLDRGSSVGRKYGDLLGRSERLIDLIARSLLTGESLSREVVPLLDPAGKVTHLGAMVSPVLPGPENTPPGRPAEGVLCLLADLTEIRALREKVGLKENLAVLGEMSAGIAHEFRNALATIHGLARLIVKANGHGGREASTQREHAETILREVEGIERVVTDFLRYARPVTLNLSEVDLQDLVDNLAREAREEAAPAGVAIEVRGTFPRIVADEALVRQAIRNLLLNAIEAFPPSGPAASARAPSRRVIVHGEPQTDPQRAGNREGEPAAHLHAVLHHQGARHGAGAGPGAEDRRRPRRPGRGPERSRARHRLRAHPPGPPRRPPFHPAALTPVAARAAARARYVP